MGADANLYAYVSGSPPARIDPDGLDGRCGYEQSCPDAPYDPSPPPSRGASSSQVPVDNQGFAANGQQTPGVLGVGARTPPPPQRLLTPTQGGGWFSVSTGNISVSTGNIGDPDFVQRILGTDPQTEPLLIDLFHGASVVSTAEASVVSTAKEEPHGGGTLDGWIGFLALIQTGTLPAREWIGWATVGGGSGAGPAVKVRAPFRCPHGLWVRP
jgi:hypothetical protein